nr:molybdopterin dinucleotide binding domain-containing protein [Caloramator mitchellensis]
MGKNEGLMKIAGESYVEINTLDAKKFGIEDLAMVKVESRRGEIKVKARVTDIVDEGVFLCHSIMLKEVQIYLPIQQLMR